MAWNTTSPAVTRLPPFVVPGNSVTHASIPLAGLYAATFCVGLIPVLPSSTKLWEWPGPPRGPRAVGLSDEPIGLSFTDHASFLPVTYNSPVRGLNEEE